jgi:hypothetical protein
MKKLILSLAVYAACLLTFVYQAQAGLINYERRNKSTPAAARKTGAYPSRPTAAAPVEVPMAAWLKTPPGVKNAAEKAYDVNRDGKLQSAEVKIYLRDVIKVIESKGGFTINSDVLKEYDKNRDGVISRFELPDLKRDTES